MYGYCVRSRFRSESPPLRSLLLATAFSAAAILRLAAQPPAAEEPRRPVAGEAVYDRLRPSILTVEVHPLAGEAKSTLGSGYVAGDGGRIVTNYHVIGAYVAKPRLYRLLVKSGGRSHPARLVAFDLINDLALLEADVAAPPLRLASRTGAPGSPIIAFGNPEGLGLSLVEGVFNGFAEKGFIERMLLSMPLNSGMSGGPILDARREVVGTNVSVYRDADSLSFGVPVTHVHALLAAPPLGSTDDELHKETQRQLGALGELLTRRVVEPMQSAAPALMAIGGARLPRLPEAFECWNTTHELETEGIDKTSFQCNLQFTPSLDDVGEVGSLQVLVEHFTSRESAFGFYGGLSEHGSDHHGVEARAPGNGMLSPPVCRSDRLRTGHLAFKASTCSYAYVRHPGLGYFALGATSLSRPREAVYVAVHGTGVRLDTFLAVARWVMEQVRLEGA